MNIDNTIKLFADFLNISWTIIPKLLNDRDYTSNEDSLNDWLQANWELLVERKILNIGEYLEIYGDGADFYGASSRITDKEAIPNFQVIVKPLNMSNIYDVLNNESVELIDCIFDKFVSFKNDFYYLEPEFNYILVLDYTTKKERVFALSEIYFGLKTIDKFLK